MDFMCSLGAGCNNALLPVAQLFRLARQKLNWSFKKQWVRAHNVRRAVRKCEQGFTVAKFLRCNVAPRSFKKDDAPVGKFFSQLRDVRSRRNNVWNFQNAAMEISTPFFEL
jgi:hypothetical protein